MIPKVSIYPKKSQLSENLLIFQAMLLSEIRRREKSLQEKVNNVRSIFGDRTERTQQKKKEKELG